MIDSKEKCFNSSRNICDLIFTFENVSKLTQITFEISRGSNPKVQIKSKSKSNYYVFYFVDHKRAVPLHTDAVFPVPVQLVPWWTGTLITPQRVDASVFTASAIYAAFIDIYE